MNRAAAAVTTDLAYGVPFALVRAADLAYLAALRKSASQLRAIRWPAPVRGYITAMMLTYDPASITCAQAVAAAGSNSAATRVLTTKQACAQAHNTTNQREIRVLLHLPSTAGYLSGM